MTFEGAFSSQYSSSALYEDTLDDRMKPQPVVLGCRIVAKSERHPCSDAYCMLREQNNPQNQKERIGRSANDCKAIRKGKPVPNFRPTHSA